MRHLVGGKFGVPGGFQRQALGLGVPGFMGFFGKLERRMAPAQRLARELDLLGAQRLAMGLGGVGAVRRALADVGLADDQRRFVGAVFGVGNRAVHCVGIVAVDRADHVPAIGGKTHRGVVDEPGADLAVDGDAVVVIQRDQLVELPGAGQRAGFVADAFHQAAVAHEDVGMVVDDAVAGLVELRGHQFFRQRHADRVADALAQRTGGGFNAGGVAELGVARGFAVQLAEVFQFLDRQVVASQVQQRIDQHGAVAVGQHEAVAVEPAGIVRAVLEVPAPQRDRHVGHAHGRAGVAGVGLLHGVHGQGADGVGHEGGGGVSHLRGVQVGEEAWGSSRVRQAWENAGKHGKTPDFTGCTPPEPPARRCTQGAPGPL